MKLIFIATTLLAYCTHGVTANDPFADFGGRENTGYLAWLDGTNYSKHAFIESSKEADRGVALHWTIAGDRIQLAVAAKATGWVGFGIGESGSMLGADIVMYSAETNELVDAHVLDQTVTPLRDDCQAGL